MSEATTSPAEAGLVKLPEVRCAHVEMVDPKTLVPHPSNPNEHPPKQIEMFIAILGFQGWRRAITVSTRSGFVTKGHGALEAALAAGYPLVPVDRQAYGSEAEELADLAADNQLQRMSEMNAGKLQTLLVKLNDGQFNMEMTGFDTVKLEKLLSTGEAPKLNLAGADGGAVPPPGGPLGQAPDGAPPMPSQVRMIQLFFNEETVAEFTRIVEFFQNEIKTDNVTDTVMSIMRSAFDAHTAPGARVGDLMPGESNHDHTAEAAP